MKLTVGKGIDDYVSSLEKLNLATEGQIKMAIYEGAKVVAEEIKKNVRALPVQDTWSEKVTGIKSIQKKGLEYGFGISKMKVEGGEVNTKLGFDGYNKLKTKKHPEGQPNAMIARTFESGNSFTKKIPFVAPAVRAKKAEAERIMGETIDKEISKVVSTN